MNDGEQLLVRHGFDHANGQHQLQSHGQLVHPLQPVHVLHPSEQQMLHIGGSRQQQSASKPFFEVLLEFIIEILGGEKHAA